MPAPRSLSIRASRPGRPCVVRRARGYTFLEIMLVVVIIGILAALVAPNLVGQTENAKINATRSNMTAVTTALGMYEIKSGSFPSSSEGLQALVTRPSNFPETEWPKGGFIKAGGLPKDGWNRPFQYAYPSEHGGDFDLSSAGKDGQFGTADDITNWGDKDSGK